MYNFVSVAVFDSTNNLLKKSPSFVFSHLAILDDVIEELTASVFEDHDDL